MWTDNQTTLDHGRIYGAEVQHKISLAVLTRPVQIDVQLAIHPGYRAHSFDCRLHTLMQRKRRKTVFSAPRGNAYSTREHLRETRDDARGLGQFGDD